MDLTVLSCSSFLLLSALFLHNVASISKSRGTKLPVGDLCIYNTNRTTVIRLNKKRQKELRTNIHKNNQRITNKE